ncbi:MAG: CRISPR-associated endonuclease Cas6 [Candidatus Wallbacteria bacterium]|nr:CRISPR-associated endonuclease Cas6 [Candidatus Wallbacteria bacterium]
MPSEFLHVRRLQLYTVPPFQGSGVSVRRAITAAVPDEPLLHNHADGPSQPLVRYSCQAGVVELVAIGAAIALAGTLAERLKRLRVGQNWFVVKAVEVRDEKLPFGECAESLPYVFDTPWLALNEDNHRRFLGTVEGERKQLLQRILAGNLLSLSKAVGHNVSERLVPELEWWEPVPCYHKGVSLVGFRAAFRVNFHVPPGLGLGKLVAKGFGRVGSPGREGG